MKGKSKVMKMTTKSLNNVYKKIIACLILTAIFTGYILPIQSVFADDNDDKIEYWKKLIEQENEEYRKKQNDETKTWFKFICEGDGYYLYEQLRKQLELAYNNNNSNKNPINSPISTDYYLAVDKEYFSARTTKYNRIEI